MCNCSFPQIRMAEQTLEEQEYLFTARQNLYHNPHSATIGQNHKPHSPIPIFHSPSNTSMPWVPPLAGIISAPLLSPNSVSQPSPHHINLAMVVINLANTTDLKENFRKAVKKTVLSILLFTTSPINIIVVTDSRSLHPVSRFFGLLVAEQVPTNHCCCPSETQVTMRVIIHPSWRWRRQKTLANITFAFVNSQGIVSQRQVILFSVCSEICHRLTFE